MKRRIFLQLTGGVASALALGVVPEVVGRLRGKAYFNDWRALPGMQMVLKLEVDEPENTIVELIVEDEKGSQTVARSQGASMLGITVPFHKTDQDSYTLYARVVDLSGHGLESDRVEVIAESFKFGM